VKIADGAAKEDKIYESDTELSAMSWSGNFIVYRTAPGADAWAIAVTGEKKPIPILHGIAFEQSPQISPDGKWIAYSSNETGGVYQIYVKPFPEGPQGVQWQVSTEGGFFPRWRGDGKELFFMNAPGGGLMMAADIHVMGASIVPGVPQSLFGSGFGNLPHGTLQVFSYHAYAVSADGQRFLIPQVSGALGGDLADQLAQLADHGGLSAIGAGLPSGPITVVLNWPSALKRK
jgi:hypothetical protein